METFWYRLTKVHLKFTVKTEREIRAKKTLKFTNWSTASVVHQCREAILRGDMWQYKCVVEPRDRHTEI